MLTVKLEDIPLSWPQVCDYCDLKIEGERVSLVGSTLDHRFQIHHIDPFSEAMLLSVDPGNLVRLCVPCHKKVERNSRRWKRKLLTEIGESKA